MKKIIVVLSVLVVALSVVVAVLACRVTSKNAKPLIDAEQNSYGGLNIYVEGKGFDSWSNVVDYVEGDPANLCSEPVHGIFVVLENGSSEAVNMAIKEDGEVERIDAAFKLLPRAAVGETFILVEEEELSISLTLQEDNTYSISIKGKGMRVESDGVQDAWTAYDTVYWLQDSNAYSYNWQTAGATPEIYFEGANAISHGSDESEGALVPLEKANYKAYGRSDIFSPYGN